MQKIYQGPMNATGTYTYPLFDTFWNNTGLRGSVFTRTLKSEALRDEFPLLVDNLSSLLYSFIEIK
jgi:hypothetical protein